MVPRSIGILALLVASALARSASGQPAGDRGPADELLLHVLKQGISPTSIMGFDERGIPLVCGEPPTPTHIGGQALVSPAGLPSGTRGWACIPSIILADGLDSFHLEVNANGPVDSVTIPNPFPCTLLPSPGPLILYDDGTHGDRIAGDFVFTIGPFVYNTSCFYPPNFMSDAASPAGLYETYIGDVVIRELNGTTTTFLIGPNIGLLKPDIARSSAIPLAADAQMTEHLINVRTDYHATGRFLHVSGTYEIPTLTTRIYELLPDVIHQFMFFSIDRVELMPRGSGSNFNAGVHASARVEYTGSSVTPFDATALYGSSGVLMGLNGLDNLGRGVYSGNAMHEITHQWAAWIDNSFGMTDGAHYKPRSSAASLVGGQQWIAGVGGSYTLNCGEGRNGAHHAPPLDRYMAGFIDGSGISLHKYDDARPAPLFLCDSAVTSVLDVDIEDIQALHGTRSPGPASSQKHFNVVFVAESDGRLLNETEMTFYEILAAYFMAVVPAGEPDPFIGGNWVPATRYWGPGVTWNSRILRTTGIDPGRPDELKTGVIAPVPHPLRPGGAIRFELTRPGTASLRIYDVAGRLVREFDLKGSPEGKGQVIWDGTDGAGRAVSGGVYFIRLISPAGVVGRAAAFMR